MSELLIQQMEIIEQLTSFCSELINELAQYKNVEKEEEKFNMITNE